MKNSFRLTKKVLAVFLSLLMVMSAVPVTMINAGAVNSISGGHSQEHTVDDYQTKNAGYTYITNCAVPMDGTNGNPDLCIPGQNRTDNMVPQGMSYWEAKNWVLISSYNEGGGQSVVYALDFSTGEFVAQFNLFTDSALTEIMSEHVSGIACSENNLYIADAGSTMSYIPLSELNVSRGTVKSVYTYGTVNLTGELDTSNTSYASFGDGVVWTGNFHIEGSSNDSYKKYANRDSASLLIGYDVSGFNSSSEEWNHFSSLVGNPTHIIPLTSYGIEKVQCATVKDGKVYVGTSYGRTNDSNLYIFDVSLSNPTIQMIVADKSRKACVLTNKKQYTHLPMTEGLFVYGSNMYNIFESACFFYNGADPKSLSKNPTDVVWKFNVEALNTGSQSFESFNYNGISSKTPWFHASNGYKAVGNRYFSNILYTEERWTNGW